jgi:hypothetical protein
VGTDQAIPEKLLAQIAKMQAKDIPERPILEFLRDLPLIAGTAIQQWGCCFKSERCYPANSVLHAMPAEVTAKLGLAKMKRLIQRGLVSGCTCGCRGDFELTAKGKEYLTSSQPKA